MRRSKHLRDASPHSRGLGNRAPATVAEAAALLRDCETETQVLGGDPLYLGHCCALRGNIAVRRGDLDRANDMPADGLLLYRKIDSQFDVAGILSQQGLLALRRGGAAAARELFMQSLPHDRDCPSSPWAAQGLGASRHSQLRLCALQRRGPVGGCAGRAHERR
ncbi:MAG: hypothetical protein H7Z19_07230 [Chitinophagaceae bacterium]|nr:hypothetical protein [Rubrivivax sp.]